MIFQSELTNIDTEITGLLAQVEAAKQRQTQLIELDTLTDHTLEGLADVVSKIQCSAPDAIASLKTAVLTLFDDGDDGSDGRWFPLSRVAGTNPIRRHLNPMIQSLNYSASTEKPATA